MVLEWRLGISAFGYTSVFAKCLELFEFVYYLKFYLWCTESN